MGITGKITLDEITLTQKNNVFILEFLKKTEIKKNGILRKCLTDHM